MKKLKCVFNVRLLEAHPDGEMVLHGILVLSLQEGDFIAAPLRSEVF